MHAINGEPRLSAKGHEVFAEMHEDSARVLRKAAAEMPPEHPDAAVLLGLALRQEGAAKGHLFRAEELRYNARGGMTAALERRRFEPGARWLLHCIELVVERANIFGLPLVHFAMVSRPVERDEMTRANGWLFLGLADPAAYR